MEYNKIISTLKRYTFEEKMRLAQIYSRKTIIPSNTANWDKSENFPYPWELETFVLNAVKAQEWKADRFQGKNASKFIDIINAIRKAKPSALDSFANDELVTWVSMTHAAVQFESQEYQQFKMFRFNYFFSFCNSVIDMPSLFYKKFGCTYYEFLLLGDILSMAFAVRELTQEIYNAIIKRFSLPVTSLTLSRQEYITALDRITTDPANYLFCLRPSYSYPFISHNTTVYCPLPHLLYRATTSSMMHRLTEGNTALMSLIGKEVYENYLYTIIEESQIFDRVIPEQTYSLHGTPRRTTDVMAQRDDTYVFFDSKSFTPKSSLRTFSQSALGDDIRRLAESIEQVYKHIRRRFPTEYCYFPNAPTKQNFEIYGLVIVQEHAHILGKNIYPKVAEELKISQDSDEYVWLYTHVGVASIYDIERFCFCQTDMCPALRKIKDEGNMCHSWLSSGAGGTPTYKRYTDFADQLTTDVDNTLRSIAK